MEFGKPKIEKNLGIPFEIEKKFLAKGFYYNSFILSKMYTLVNKHVVDELEKVLSITESIGITTNHEKINIRAYEILKSGDTKN